MYFIETGLVLVVGPWTAWWRRNFFAQVLPGVSSIMSSPFVRYAVVVMGLVTLLTGVAEVWSLLFGRSPTNRSSRPSSY